MTEVTMKEAEELDRHMDDHMHGHVISNSPNHFACDIACRTEALRKGVEQLLRNRADKIGTDK